MPVTTYNYTKAGLTQREVMLIGAAIEADSGIIVAYQRGLYGDPAADDLDLTFADVLPGGEETALTALVGAYPYTAYRSGRIWIPAMGMAGATTAGAAGPTQFEDGTNDVDNWVMDFDKTVKKYATRDIILPSDYDGGTMTARFFWRADAGVAAEEVRWGAQGRAYADDDPIDAAWGTAQEVTDTLLALKDEQASAETPALTLAGAPAADQRAVFRLFRDPAHGDDNLDADARLLGALLLYAPK